MNNKNIERKQLRPVKIDLRLTAPTPLGPNNGSAAAGLRLDPAVLSTTFKLNPPNLSALPDLSPSEFWAHYMVSTAILLCRCLPRLIKTKSKIP